MPIAVLTVAQMREWEQATWATGVSDQEVIEKVGAKLARRILSLTRSGDSVLLIAGGAAAGLVANGAAALAAAGALLLERAGVSESVAPKMLGPLLRSVADNVERLGFPDALTGPVRRGDATGVERHFQTIAKHAPEAIALYLAVVEAQIPLAREIGDRVHDHAAATKLAVGA